MTPLITIPIISDSFGPSGIGLISYSSTIMQYFLLFVTLGVQLYYNRIIANSRNSEENLARDFWSILYSKIIFGIFVLMVYIIVIIVFIKENQIIYYIQGIYIIGAMIDISWFYAGLEDFKLTSLSNVLASIGVLIVVIVFINDSSDLLIYVFIINIVTVCNQIPLYIRLRRYNLKNTFDKALILLYFKNSFQYLLPTGSFLFCNMITITLLRVFADYFEVGIISNGFNLVSIIVTLVTTIDLVLIPKLSRVTSNYNYDKLIKFLFKNINIQLFLTIPLAFGLTAIMPIFHLWFFGEKFNELVNISPYLSILIIIIPLNTLISRQFILVTNQMRYYNLTIIYSCLINFILGLIFIPHLGLIGALIIRIIAEIYIMISRFKKIRSFSQFEFDFSSIIKATISSLIMYISVIYINFPIENLFIVTIFQLIVGVIIFVITSLLLKNKLFINLLSYLN